MTYTTPTWTEFFNNAFSSSLFQSLTVMVGVVLALLVLGKVLRVVGKWSSATSNGPRLSRASRKLLEREGVPTQIKRYNQYYRGTAHRRANFR